MASGALETTANSSGTTFSNPTARLRSVHPPSENDASPTTQRKKEPARYNTDNSVTDLPARLARRFAPAKQAVYDHQGHTDGNGRVRHVEDVEVPLREMEVEKIHDRAAKQPVDHIADRAADDETDARGKERMVHPAQPKDEPRYHNGCQRREDDRVERGVAVEQAEAHAPVPSQCKIEEGRQNDVVAGRPLGEKREDPTLGELIENDDEAGQAQAEPQHQTPLAAARAPDAWSA